MRFSKWNPVLQFTAMAGAIVVLFLAVSWFLIQGRHQHALGHLKEHQAAMAEGRYSEFTAEHIAELIEDTNITVRMSAVVVAGGLLLLFGSSVLMVWSGWRTAKRQHMEITESQAMYEALFENSPVGTGIADMNGDLIAYNSAMLRAGGYTAEDMESIGNVSGLYARQEDRDEVLRLLQDQGSVVQYEVQFKRKDGSLYDTLLTLVPTHFHGKRSVQAVVEDITKRKRAEQALSDSEARLNGILDSAGEAIVSVDQEQNIILYNRAAESMFGHTAAEALGRPMDMLLPPRYVQSHRAKVDGFAFPEGPLNSQTVRMEVTGLRRDGTEFPAETTVWKLDQGDGVVLTSMVLDVTERKRAEAQQRLRSQELGTLAAIATYLALPATLQEKANLLLEELRVAIEADEAIFMVGDQDSESLELVATVRAYPAAPPQGVERLPVQGTLAGKVLMEGGTAVVDDILLEPTQVGVAQVGVAAVDRGMRSRVAVQISAGDRPFGVVSATSTRVAHFTPERVALLNAIASGIGPLLDNARLQADNLREIDERRRVEDALRESEGVHRAVVESVGDGIVICSDDTMLYVNQAFLDIHGFKESSEAIGRPMSSFVGERDRERVQLYSAARQRGENAPSFYEYRLVRGDGVGRVAQVVASAIRYKGLPATISVIRDVTESRRAEEHVSLLSTISRAINLQEDVQSSLAVVLEEMCRATEWVYGEVWVPSADGSVLELSPANCANSDAAAGFRTASEVVTLAPGVGLPGRVWETGELEWTSDLSKGTPESFPRALLGRDFGMKAALGVPIKTNGEMLAVLVFMMHEVREADTHLSDLVSGVAAQLGLVIHHKMDEEARHKSSAELERTFHELRDAQEQLIQAAKLVAIGELVSGVAHELNNPLTGIWGLSQLVAAKDLDPQLKGDLEMINAEASRAVKIVQNLLSFARKHAPEQTWASVNEAVEKTVELRAYGMKVNNIDLETDLQPDLPEARFDFNQMRQVFLNIVTNAEQEMVNHQGGGRLLVATRQVGDSIRITFTDNGGGIRPEIADKLFDPFFTTKEVGQGSGLGLSICYGIVQEHNGRIWVENRPGEGATFIVEIPIDGRSGEEKGA